MRIGQVARRAGVTTKAIRHYERLGLLGTPARTPSGYRDFAPEAIERVRFIRRAQAAGLSLREIGDVIAVRESGRAPCAHAIALLEARARDLRLRIAELERARARVVALAERGRGLDPAACAEEPVCGVLAPADE
ncbi:MAG: heavy metal-responsive transcriptional regulator [Thermoleophilia bacterium]|nr:heavy metal-responsive transcriptional regulator [Thermoleophilia bacterium]